MEVIEVTEKQYANIVSRRWLVFHRKAEGKFYLMAGLATMPVIKSIIQTI